MKKIIQILTIIILLSILCLILILSLNPFNLRTRLIGSVINSYLSSNIKNYSPIKIAPNTQNPDSNTTGSTAIIDKNPLLSDSQEKTLESFGVDVSKLPQTITPGMKTCFMEEIGQERGMELINGSSPGVFEIIKIKKCLKK